MKALESFGLPESFAAYLIRVGKVLGIDTFGFVSRQGNGWHDSNEYRWFDAAGIAYWIPSASRKIYEREEVAG